EASAALPGEELKRLVRQSAEALATDLAKLPDEAWSRQVTTFRGGSLPASGIPWLRAREVAVHTVDLDAGVGFGDLPPDLVAALVREIVDKRLTDGEGPALAAWLTGRSTGPTALAPWLWRTPRPPRVRCRRAGPCRSSAATRSGPDRTTGG